MVETRKVDDAQSLREALSTAGAGTTIELAPGHYGALNLSGAHGDPWARFADEVTIRSADPDNPATISDVYLNGVTNLTFDGIEFDYTTSKNLTYRESLEDNAILVRDSTDITIRNSVLEGDVLDDPGSSLHESPVGRGFLIRGSEGITLEGNEILNWYRGGVFLNNSDVLVKDNDVHTIRSDGFNFAAVQDVLIEDNYMHDFVMVNGGTEHRDMIQIWTAGTDTPSTNITIRDNYLNSGSGAWTQSIFMRNEAVGAFGAGPRMFYRDVLIENNVIYNAHLHGITVGETDGLVIRNNTLLHNPDSGDDGGVSRPRINVWDGARNVQIERNVTEYVPSADAGWKIASNLLVQNEGPEKPNYYGDLFINALTGGGEADLAALQALPGSVVEKGGYGAALTRFDKTPDELTAVIRPESAGGDTFSFDGGYTANSKGLVGSGASFKWDMGDGTARTGTDVEHTYAEPGTYLVTLTVTDADGNKDSALAEAYVPEPTRLDLNVMAEGLVDESTYLLANLPVVQVVQDGGRHAVRLTDKTGFGLKPDAAPLFDLDAFTIEAAISARSGAASAGEIFRIHNSMRLIVEADGSFGFDFINDAGQKAKLRSEPTSALDGEWHTVSLTYDQSDGVLALYLDGGQVGSVAASGSTRPLESWGLNFGSIFGKTGFDGLIDDIKIEDEARFGDLGGPASSPDTPSAPDPEPNPEPDQAPEPEPTPGTGGPSADLVYRWNAGRNTVEATDGGPDWVADSGAITGSAGRYASPSGASGKLDDSVPGTTPKDIFAQEYWGNNKAAGMGLEFGDGTLAAGSYAVRLYMGNCWSGASNPGDRVFDVSVEGELFLDDLDLVAELGHQVGGMFEWQGTVDDGTIDIDFAHIIENPLINGVEIILLDPA